MEDNFCLCVKWLTLYVWFFFSSFLSFSYLSLSRSSLHPDRLIIPSDTQTFSLHTKSCKNCCPLPKLIRFIICEAEARAHAHTHTKSICPKSNICFWETLTAVLTSKIVLTCFFLFPFFHFISFFSLVFLYLLPRRKRRTNADHLVFRLFSPFHDEAELYISVLVWANINSTRHKWGTLTRSTVGYLQIFAKPNEIPSSLRCTLCLVPNNNC